MGLAAYIASQFTQPFYDNIFRSDSDPKSENTEEENNIGDVESGEGIDLTDTDTWPRPPADGELEEIDHPRDKKISLEGKKFVRTKMDLFGAHISQMITILKVTGIEKDQTRMIHGKNVDIDENLIPK